MARLPASLVLLDFLMIYAVGSCHEVLGTAVLPQKSTNYQLCKYTTQGQWSRCDSQLLLATRTDSLRNIKDLKRCPQFRNITKPCRLRDEYGQKISVKNCVFQHGREVPWSACDFSAQVRYKKMNLIKRRSKSKDCPTQRTLAKPCLVAKKKPAKAGKNLEECTLEVSTYGQFLGRITVELRNDIVPKTVKNFRSLCVHKYGFGYENSTFHSIKPNLMLEGGDFERRDGTGGHSIYGRTFPDENFKLKHKKFAVSMANLGRKNSNGSKFFITSAALPKLDGSHVVFGRVKDKKSHKVIGKLEKFGNPFDGQTTQQILISKCTCKNDAGKSKKNNKSKV